MTDINDYSSPHDAADDARAEDPPEGYGRREPLDLTQVAKLIAQRDAEFADEQREAVRRLLDEVLPDLLDEVADFRAAEEVWADLPTRTEWAMSRDGQTPPATRWYGTAKEAEQAYGRPGQLWCRTVTIGSGVPIANEPPF